MVIMGILNITPDSFSDGGMLGTTENDIFVPDMDKVLFKVEQMINEGADIIDVGGESTRPGFSKVVANAEIDRIAPVITNIKSRFNIKVSVDTYKATVAREAVRCGADIINDIGGFTLDENMGYEAAKLNVPYVLTYNGYSDDPFKDINELTDKACSYGISQDKLIMDPGVGFGKTAGECLRMVERLDELCKLDVPVLLGTSRKSFIEPNMEALRRLIPENLLAAIDEYENPRLKGTLITTALAVKAGCYAVRVHDIKENVRIVSLAARYYNGV